MMDKPMPLALEQYVLLASGRPLEKLEKLRWRVLGLLKAGHYGSELILPREST